MANSAQKVVRGTMVAFEQLFVDADGVSPIVPVDPLAYPSVSIVSPAEEIIQSGVATSLGDGRWRFQWFVPADAMLGGPDTPWRIDWMMVTNGGRQIERQSNFVVIDNIEASPDERQYTMITYCGQSERVIIKFKNAQAEKQCFLVNRANTTYDLTPFLQEVQQDGFYIYYADTPTLSEGAYLVRWQCRQTVVSPATTFIHQIRVPEQTFWWLQPDLRMLIDKIQKKVGHVQAYSDADMYAYFLRGVDTINATNPITSWDLTTFPFAYGMTNFLLAASAWWGLQAQYISEGELAFNFGGQTTTLDVDRTGTYSDAMSRLKDYLDNELQKTKRNMLRRVSTGVLATRPYDFGLTSLVAKVQTVQGGSSQILPLMSRLGLL
jgi:hypothetical protein